MRNKYSTTFIVQGSNAFPVDMLRYDACAALTVEDQRKIDLEFDPQGINTEYFGTRQVTLTRLHERKDPHLTDARWRSFTWRIVSGSVRTERI